MRKVIYSIGGLFTTTSYKEAMAWKEKGIDFTTQFEEISEKGLPRTPLHEAMLQQFGYVSPKLKDKVVMP